MPRGGRPQGRATHTLHPLGMQELVQSLVLSPGLTPSGVSAGMFSKITGGEAESIRVSKLVELGRPDVLF